MSYRPQKLYPKISRLTMGRDQIVCLYDVSTPTSDLPKIKIIWNSVLSTPGANFLTVNITSFYLGTPMDRPEFMRLPIKIIPQEIIDNNNLRDIVNNQWVYYNTVRGMYGLSQAGKIANNLLKKYWSGSDTMQPNSHQNCG